MPLPRYNPQGIMYADLPRVSTANLEAGAEMYTSVNRRLDQLMGIINKEGTAYAKKEAIKFASENPVTQEQIDAANNDLGPIESMLAAFSGQGGTVYREALQEAQGAILGTELQADAISKINLIQRDAEMGFRVAGIDANGQPIRIPFSADEAKAEIADMSDGYYATVSALNQSAALKLKAGIATAGNSAMKSLYNLQVSQFKAESLAKIESMKTDVANAMVQLYQQQPSFDPQTGAAIPKGAQVDAMVKTITDYAIATNNMAEIPKIQAIKSQAAYQAILQSYGPTGIYKDPVQLLTNLENGTAIELQEAYADINPEDRTKLKNELYTHIKRTQDSNSALNKAEREKFLKRRGEIQKEIALGNLSEERRDELLNEMLDINIASKGDDVFSWSFIKSFQKGDETKSRATAEQMARLRQQVRDGALRPEDTDRMMDNLQLSGAEKEELDNLFATVSNKSIKANRARLKTKIASLAKDKKKFGDKLLKEADELFIDAVVDDKDGTLTVDQHMMNAFEIVKDKFDDKILSDATTSAVGEIEMLKRRMSVEYKAKSPQDLLALFQEKPWLIEIAIPNPKDRVYLEKLIKTINGE